MTQIPCTESVECAALTAEIGTSTGIVVGWAIESNGTVVTCIGHQKSRKKKFHPFRFCPFCGFRFDRVPL